MASMVRTSPTAGLSPRVRGNPSPVFHVNASTRSIPARAGEPCKPTKGRNVPWVYPRACGGTVMFRYDRMADTGLSPRVRGNRRRACVTSLSGGSIPARAGEPVRKYVKP